MGSTSEWGWGCESQVFGGTRAYLRPAPSGDANNQGTRRRRRPQDLQSKNFKTMVAWLSSSSDPGSTAPGKTLLEVALERRDGGPAAAFMTLMSLAPEALAAEEEEAGDNREGDAAAAVAATHDDPVAFLLRLYHAGGTWRRVSREPPARRHGRGSRLHPNDSGLAAAVDEADERERCRRSTADHAAALALVGAGLVISLDAAAGGGGGGVSRRGAAGRGGGSSGGGGGTVSDGPDPLVALALVDALTAAELRSLAKALGINVGQGGAVDAGGKGGQGRRWSSGSGSSNSAVDAKDEVCRALERWLTRPEDAAKRRSRLARAARQAAELVSAAGRKDNGGSGSGGGGGGGGSEVLVIRLADDAREAVQRIHAAFFAAAQHGPHDVSAILREDLDRVVFGGGGGGGVGFEEARAAQDERAGWLSGSRPPPAILSSVEAFAEFFRLVSLADGMEMAARAGDSG